MSIQCENPLTAADFDGVSMAVGTSRGKVLVYDLRSPKTPTKTFIAHNTSVTSMVFKHKVDRQQVAQVMSVVKAKPKPKLSQHKSTPSLRTVQEETKENTEPPTEHVNEMVETDGMEKEVFAKADESVFLKDDSLFCSNRRESLSSQLFSPLRDADTSFPGSQAGYSVCKEPRRVSEVRLSSDGLFSPLREANSPASSVASLQLSYNKKTPYTSFTTPTMSPLSSIREEANKSPSSPAKPRNITRGSLNPPEKLSLEKLDEFVKEASAGEKSPLFDKELHGNEDCGGAFKLSVGERHTLVQDSLEEEKPPNIVKPSISYSRSQPEDFLSVLTAFPDLGLELGDDHHSSMNHVNIAASRIADRLTTTPDSGVATFQRDYISGMVSEAMEEWCSGVERRLWGLQYSLLRQLQQHQEETKAMLAESSGMGEMREELSRLRRENMELRKFFGAEPEEGRQRES